MKCVSFTVLLQLYGQIVDSRLVEEDVLFQTLAQAIKGHIAAMADRHGKEVVTSRIAQLSQREREVLEHVLRGRMNKQIAFDLGIAEKTVKVHRGRVMEKMAVASVAELVHLCDAAGIAFPSSSPAAS